MQRARDEEDSINICARSGGERKRKIESANREREREREQRRKWERGKKSGTNGGRLMVARGVALRAFNIFEPIAY